MQSALQEWQRGSLNNQIRANNNDSEGLIIGRVRSVVRTLLRRFLSVFGKRGPVRGVYQSSRDFFKKSSAGTSNSPIFSVIFPSATVDRTPPTDTSPDLADKFEKIRSHDFPECFVINIPRGRVVSDRGMVLTPDHRLLFDVSNQMSVRNDFGKVHHHQAFRRNIFPPIEKAGKRVAVLATAGGGNFFHWITEALPRLKLLEKNEDGNLDRIDSFVINKGSSFLQESLDILGIGKERTIETDWNSHLQAEELLVPSLPGVTLNPPRWACEFLRERVLPYGSGEGSGNRLYIRRGENQRRGVVNDEEIIDALHEFGFTAVDPGAHSLREQIAIFGGAEMIVGSHGGALTNLLWCNPGTKVLELLPHSGLSGWFWPYCYWALSNSCDLEYHCFGAQDSKVAQENELYAEQSFSVDEVRSWVKQHMRSGA